MKNTTGSAMPRLIQYMKDRMGVILLATIMSDGLFGDMDLAAIGRIGVFLAVIYLLSALLGFIQHYIMASVTLKMSYQMRGELSDKINRVPQKYFNTTSQGDILSRITNDVSTLQQGLTNSLPTIVSAATQFVGCLVMMFVTEWRLALISLGITIFGMLLIVIIMSRSQKYFTARQKSLGDLNGYVEEMYSGHEVVRISLAEKKVNREFDRMNAAVYDANWKSQFLSGVMQPLITAFSYTDDIAQVTTIVGEVAEVLSGEDMQRPEKAEKLPADNSIELKNVRFAYHDKEVLHGVSLHIVPGRVNALVGPSGSGKSTIARLIASLWDVKDGATSARCRWRSVRGASPMSLRTTTFLTFLS